MTRKSTTPPFQSLLELMGIMFLRFPYKWRLWVALLMVLNGGGVVMFPSRIETQVTAIAFVSGATLMTFLYSRYGGFTRLLGLGHILWPFLVLWLALIRIPVVQNEMEGNNSTQRQALLVWLASVVVVDSFSLYLDIRDVLRYFGGDKAPVLHWNQDNKNDKNNKDD